MCLLAGSATRKREVAGVATMLCSSSIATFRRACAVLITLILLPAFVAAGASGRSESSRGISDVQTRYLLGTKKSWPAGSPALKEAKARPLGSRNRSKRRAAAAGDCSFIEELTIKRLQQMYALKQVTTVQVVQCYLQRIRDISDPRTHNPEASAYPVNAIIEYNPKALQEARYLDMVRTKKCVGRKPTAPCPGPMHGVVVLIKDNIAADGMNNTAGSYALLGCQFNQSTVATKLRQAGALILGKAGMTEWASFREFSNFRMEGWSARGGQVYSPYVQFVKVPQTKILQSPYRNVQSVVEPGMYTDLLNPETVTGSSSGSGAACATNLATVTVGTETTGSIILPSESHSLVGIKPTTGLISRTGVVPFTPRQDTPGPMGRTVMDAVVLLNAMYGMDPADPDTLRQRTPKGGYLPFLKTGGLQRKYLAAVNYGIGDVRDGDGAILDAYNSMLQSMRDLGAEINVLDITSDGSIFPGYETTEDPILFNTEFKMSIQSYLKKCQWKRGYSPLRTLRDLINFNINNANLEFQGGKCCRGDPVYGNYFQTIWDLADQKATDYSNINYQRALRSVSANNTYLEGWLAQEGYDAIIHLANTRNDHLEKFAQARWPTITVPMATDSKGTPIGILISGAPWSEGTLISIAYDVEQRINQQVRELPGFCETSCN